MTRVCGIDLRSSDSIIAVVDIAPVGIRFIDIEPRIIKLGNDALAANLQSFFNSFQNFVRDNHIDVIVIKKRAKRGQMAGGAVSFKLEALIQLNDVARVEFVSGQGIAASNKREPFEFPGGLNKYQQKAFMAAALYVRQLDS